MVNISWTRSRGFVPLLLFLFIATKDQVESQMEVQRAGVVGPEYSRGLVLNISYRDIVALEVEFHPLAPYYKSKTQVSQNIVHIGTAQREHQEVNRNEI